jgi:hypothetical protein
VLCCLEKFLIERRDVGIVKGRSIEPPLFFRRKLPEFLGIELVAFYSSEENSTIWYIKNIVFKRLQSDFSDRVGIGSM